MKIRIFENTAKKVQERRSEWYGRVMGKEKEYVGKRERVMVVLLRRSKRHDKEEVDASRISWESRDWWAGSRLEWYDTVCEHSNFSIIHRVIFRVVLL